MVHCRECILTLSASASIVVVVDVLIPEALGNGGDVIDTLFLQARRYEVHQLKLTKAGELLGGHSFNLIFREKENQNLIKFGNYVLLSRLEAYVLEVFKLMNWESD